MELITDFSWFTHLVIPLLIFLARIVDVSMGTIRVIFIARGFRFLAPLLGFFEVLIWLLAVQQVLGNLTNVFTYLGYASGFAAGTYIGIILEGKLSVGKVMVRIVARKDARDMLKELKESKYTVTSMGADGSNGKVRLIVLIIERHDIKHIVEIIKSYDPEAFYSIEDVRFAKEPVPFAKGKKKFVNRFGFYRKGK